MTKEQNVLELATTYGITIFSWHPNASIQAFANALTNPLEDDGCTRSHPHENMNDYCKLKTEIARLNNQSVHDKLKLAEQQKELDDCKNAVIKLHRALHVSNKQMEELSSGWGEDETPYDFIDAITENQVALSATSAIVEGYKK